MDIENAHDARNAVNLDNRWDIKKPLFLDKLSPFMAFYGHFF